MSTLKVNTIQNTSAAHSSTPEQIAQGRAKAWINFNGTGTIAIRDSFNISSITDNGVGNTIITMATAMPSTNYVVVGSSGASATDALRNLGLFNNFSTTAFIIFTIYFPDTSSFGRDDELVCCAVFGD